MVLYGLDGMTHRSQAYGLLAVGLREHWDLEQLPSIADRRDFGCTSLESSF